MILAAALALAACAGGRPARGPVPEPDPLAILERRISAPDGELLVRTRGRGPDLVLLHGLGDSGIGWSRIEARLAAAGFRVTVWDALGAGRSDKPEHGDYRLEAHVERLRVVLDALHVERATLFGNSFGGSMALLFALAHPARVERMVLVSPAAYPEGGWTAGWLWQPEVSQALELLSPAWIAGFALRMNFGDPARITTADLRAYAEEVARPGALRAFAAQQRQLVPDPAAVRRWIDGYRGLAMPALILWGSADRVLSPELGRRLQRDLPHSRLVVLDGVGHAAQLEAPDAVLREVLAFLGER